MPPTLRAGELTEELRRLEDETFEVVDIVGAGGELASTASCCSTSATTSCSCGSTSCSSTGG